MTVVGGVRGPAGERLERSTTGAGSDPARQGRGQVPAGVRRILVVDDSPALRKSLESILESWGFDIEHAENGAVGLSKLQRQRFDLVFLDLNMPVLDGPSLLRIMRARAIRVPVVLITAGAATPLATSAIRLGAAEYISKPFTSETVQQAIIKVAGVDRTAFQASRPRLLLEHPDEGVAQSLRSLLPDHVDLDHTSSFKQCMDAVERSPYQLVLLDSAVLEGEVSTAAGMVRERQKEAGILALAPRADPAARYWTDDSLDGTISCDLDEPLVHDFLYAQFLRPLVFAEKLSLTVAGFRGTPHDLEHYFTQLGRLLSGRASAHARSAGEVSIDLTRAPNEVDRLVELMRLVSDRLAAEGNAAAFQVAPAVREELSGRPELSRFVILSD